jgi:hypothetical protein
MIVPTFARRPVVGYTWIVLAAVGTGFLSFGLWVHHMFTTGLPGISLALISAASQAIAIPTSVQIFCFIATVWGSRVVRTVPMLFVFGGLATFVIGGLTGVMIALVAFNFQAHDTYFIVAHLHSVLIGGMLFPLLAGVYYYYPFVTARKLSEPVGRVAFWLIFAGFNLTFMPMHITGMRGMVRRIYAYPPALGFDWAEPALDRRGVCPRHRHRHRRVGRRPAQAQPADIRAQPMGRRHAGMGGGNAVGTLGHTFDPRDRQPLSTVGSAEHRTRRRRGAFLSARRRRRET